MVSTSITGKHSLIFPDIFSEILLKFPDFPDIPLPLN